MSRSDTIMGHEMEYALVVIDRRGERLDATGLDLFEATAPTVGPYLPWADRGIAMPNAARFYRDGTGARMELASAEVRNPADLVAQVEAGHRFMCRVARAVRSSPRIKTVTVAANTIDYSTYPATSGSHENYFIPFSQIDMEETAATAV